MVSPSYYRPGAALEDVAALGGVAVPNVIVTTTRPRWPD